MLYVGQTWDPAARLSKGRLPEVQGLQHQHGEHHDTLILVQQLAVTARSDLGDPLHWPIHQCEAAADALAADRCEVLGAALMHYFEGASPRRSHEERSMRQARLRAIQASQQVEQIHIELELNGAGNYRDLVSDHAPSAQRHVLRCAIVDGVAVVTRCELPADKKNAARRALA